VNKEEKEVELERDHYWWLHPALRGQESMGGDVEGALPWQWEETAEFDSTEHLETIDPSGPYADFAKLLYKLNGYKPGPVTGWYIVLSPKKGQYAVGQLCVDPNVPVILFKDRVFTTESEAREAATLLKQAHPGLIHTS
jgi:hypothetical protein